MFKKIFDSIMNNINVNGKTFASSRSIVISNGKVIIDGKDVTPAEKEITITVTGDVNSLEVDYCNKIDITGNVGKLSSTSADVNVTGNSGDINTVSGDVDVEGDAGSIETVSGDVDCMNVAGSVDTLSGNIKYKNDKHSH